MPRAIQDALLTISRALPTADGTVVSTDFDLGIKPGDLENYELEIGLPELTSTHLPSADTLTATVRSGNSPEPTTSTGLSFVVTGTGSTIPAQAKRFRLPSTIGRYVNVQFVANGGTGDISGVSATLKLLT